MKTKIFGFGRDCWQLLTEVPGWPDAPRAVRLRRALPILLPCAAILLMLVWNAAVRDPHLRRERIVHQALLAQDKEIEALRLSCSEQEAEDLSAQSTKMARLVLDDAKSLDPVLETLKKEAMEHHWEGTFQTSDLSTGIQSAADSQLIFLPVRAKLTSTGGPEAFPALLALFEQFSVFGKRIDLTRVGIRADEQGRYTVDINLRLVSRNPNEKTPQ